MNIYLLTQEENTGYDAYDSCIVYATSVEEAINIRPDSDKWEELNEWNDCWATKKENVRCELIGYTDENIESGLILSSFNAG